MQLRDEKPMIAYPGNWGFFGGSIEPGEKPIQSARRELYEEIKYETEEMFLLSIDRYIFDPDIILLYSFYCPLNIEVEEINLYEGFDFGLFTLEEICSKQIFSTKVQKSYPVVDHPYVENMVRKLLQKIERTKASQGKPLMNNDKCRKNQRRKHYDG